MCFVAGAVLISRGEQLINIFNTLIVRLYCRMSRLSDSDMFQVV